MNRNSNAKNMYQIKKETAKALLLVNNEGKEFWIQKRWMRDDGSLTAAGLKAEETAKTPEEKKAEWVQSNYITIPDNVIVEEREKAIKIAVRVSAEVAPKGGFVSSLVRSISTETMMWLPKAVVRNGLAPKDFLNKKAIEFAERKFFSGQVLSVSVRV
ncbi:MAG: hypothetical protein KatS3mg031_2951 [Chitinophagales bacterium]|nr:MAG: hypothetical protein KatS3mg031_2951 [Chitinophagales bacterium]